MSAIYQRARPVRWEDVVGQEHVKDVLKAALEQGRVGHAYLFSGPRGVGKTTTARLIAMTANCTGPLPKPCGECESCLSVRAGSHPDVMEIDAASNNSVDDVRDLREKVSLAAMHGGKKIYILDEAHMMSRAAFNALLKTLEEPPSHVIFILATTEPEKIIPTILSRCQHYRFRRLTPEEIAGKLGGLVQREGARADGDALHLIGRLADGAMRDGESLLERMLAAGTAITRAGVEDALGLPPGERVRGIAAALVGGDAGAAISGAAALYRDGFAARTVVEGLVAALGAALHAELGLKDTGPEARLDGADVPRLLKLQAALDEQESRFARAADQQSLELALTHALLAADASSAAAGRPAAGAATGPAASVPADLTQRLNRLEKELASLRARPAAPAGGPVVSAPVADFDPGARRAPASAAARAGTPDTGGSEPTAPTGGSWPDVLRQASIQLRAFLKPARQHAEPGYVSLSYDERNAFHAKQVAAKFDEIGRIVLSVFGPVTFELIAPEGGRRVKLGGPGGASPAAPAPAPVPTQASAPVATADTWSEPARPGGGVEVAPFEPVRGAAAARRAAPTAVPQASATQAAAPQTLGTPTAAPVRAPAPVIPEVAPPEVAVAPSPALVAALPPRPERQGPRSPDDVASAPLPHDPFGGDDPFGTEPFGEGADHVADQPPAPADAQGGDRLPPARASRELYIVEPITEEPDWNALGGPYDDSGPLTPVQEGPPPPSPRAAAVHAPVAASAVTPAGLSAPAPTAAAAPAPSRPGDIRAHPMYEDIRSRFGGRVREIGKNRNVPPTVTSSDDDAEDVDDSDV